MAIDIGTIVRVREQLTPVSIATRDFSKTLFLHTPDATTDAEEIRRNAYIHTYANIDQVEDDWGQDEAPYKAASVYFQQNPFPRGPYVVASYFNAARNGTVEGASTLASQADIRAQGATAAFTFMGASGTANMSAVTNPTTVAAALVAGINGITGVTGVTITATGSALGAAHSYTITLPATLTSVTSLDTDMGLTGDLADLLGIGSDAVYGPPVAADTSISTALSRISDEDDTWYIFTISPALEATQANILAASEWAQSRSHVYMFESDESVALTSGETTSSFARITALDRTRTFGIFSRVREGKAVSVASRFSSVDYDAIDSAIAISHKTLPGTSPDFLIDSQVDILDGKNANFYVTVGSRPRLLFGRSPGGYIDRRIWIDWLVNRLQNDILDLLGETNRIPLTARGSAQLVAVVRNVCNQGQLNGGFSPGRLSEALIGTVRQTTGNNSFDGYLPNGYLVHIGSQDMADQSNRIAPPVYIWGIYLGGLNRVNIDLIIGG